MTPPASDCLKAEYLSTSNSVGWAEAQIGPVVVLFSGGRDRARRSLKLIFANWLSQADLPRFQRASISAAKTELFDVDPAKAAGGLSAAEIERRCNLSGSRPGAALVNLMLPAGFAGIEAIDREQARCAGLILVLVLELYAREHGELPANLEALVKAGYLKSIPADPFGKGEPMHYRRAEKAADGGLVWSVWLDGIDQEGKTCISEHRPQSHGDKCFEVRIPRRAKPAVPHATRKVFRSP